MNFADVDLDPEQQAFRDGVRAFLDEHLTDAVYEEEWESGAGHNAAFHRALGDRGWILPRWPREQGGAGLTQVEASLLDAELSARNAPMITKGTTSLVLPAVVRDGDPRLAEEIVRGVARGEICICLGYTEPDVGSDLAAARTRAVRDGDEWVIDGQKMFTTGAQNCQYAFLVTRTNPDVPKHKGLTMFLCPLRDTEIRALHTLGGERTNMVFFDDVRVPDRFRLGAVDQGWHVLMGPLNAEHGIRDDEIALEQPGGMYGRPAVTALEVAFAWACAPGAEADGRPIEDQLVRRRLARAALNVELMTVAPGPMGRIASSELFIRNAEELLEMVGAEGLLCHGEPRAVGAGWLEHDHRAAQGTAIYGGTTDVHRNLIAERMLGLPRSTPRG